jgi:signal peptidase I
VFVKRGLYDFSADKEKQLIKRVIGLPGDRVVVKDNGVTIYNAQNPNGFNPDEQFEEGKTIKITPTPVDMTVPAGEVFLMGDNRSNSLDSRNFGPIPAEDIVGKLVLRILPISNFETF